MEISSLPNLCLQLISYAFQRCCVSGDPCRLSVVLLKLKSSPLTQISISDTGIGSCLEEFQDLHFCPGAENWDGLLSVKTTAICDDEINHYSINLRESVAGRRLNRLPSSPKNGFKFSGTEVCLSISNGIDNLVAEINQLFQKMLILNITDVAFELVIEQEENPDSRCKTVFLVNESDTFSFSTPNIERLKSGLENYVSKHGCSLNHNCASCFTSSRERLKVGSGTACSLENNGSSGMVMEVVITISELESTCPCFKAYSSKTEVLYFKDYKPGPISKSSLNALAGIDWKSYGLILVNIEHQDGCFLEWENLPPNVYIAMVLHFYHKQAKIPSARHKTQPDKHLTKRAVKLALNDLKEKYAGILLSGHALKICSYAPDLARSISGLILSSNDPDFQEKCFSLLGLHSTGIGGETIEDCIKNKIVSVIEKNDRRSQKSKDEEAPALFDDDCFQDSNFEENEYGADEDEGEYVFSYLD